jgi:hypothetical protein
MGACHCAAVVETAGCLWDALPLRKADLEGVFHQNHAPVGHKKSPERVGA